MTKGKYAARAANRLANLDNQLLQDKLAEIETLRTELSEIRNQLQTEQRDRGALVLARASDMSRDLISTARNDLIKEQQAHDDTRHMAARWIANFIHDLIEQNPEMNILSLKVQGGVRLGIEDFLKDLIGQHIGVYMAQILGNDQLDTYKERRWYRNIAGLDEAARKRQLIQLSRAATRQEITEPVDPVDLGEAPAPNYGPPR